MIFRVSTMNSETLSSLKEFDELSTVSVQVKAILNSRPLIPQPAHPHDLLPLTPGNFLIEQPLTSFPSHFITPTPQNRLKWWDFSCQFSHFGHDGLLNICLHYKVDKNRQINNQVCR